MTEPMLSLAAARQLIAQQLRMLAAERVPLADAAGRFLRKALTADADLPPFDRSAFDGYAVRAAETSGFFRVAREVAAGEAMPASLQPGEAARIFTGAPLPTGLDAVVMQELCEAHSDGVQIPKIERGTGVRWQGEDARVGSLLLSPGQRLGPAALSLLAQAGVAEPLVAPRPQVWHIANGSELVAPAETPAAGQIRDSNSTLVAALVREAGGEIAGQRRVGDDLGTLQQAVTEGSSSDLLLISGGASVGDFDFGSRALEGLGFTIHFKALNLRPGKPLTFATRGRQAAFVIPGNPLSHVVCWHVAIRVAMDVLLQGESLLDLIPLPLGGQRPLEGNPRETWWPARLVWGSAVTIEPLKWQSSGDLTAIATADALIRIPANSPPIPPGTPVELLRIA